jgi:hypothetical protein
MISLVAYICFGKRGRGVQRGTMLNPQIHDESRDVMTHRKAAIKLRQLFHRPVLQPRSSLPSVREISCPRKLPPDVGLVSSYVSPE